MSDDLIDSYSEANYSAAVNLMDNHPSDSIYISALGQSFKPTDNYTLTSCKFYMRKYGSPTGFGHAVLYAHTGTFGVDGKPVGSPLATSDDFDVSTLTTTYGLKEFTFSGANQYVMQANTAYCIVFEEPTVGTITTSHYVRIALDNTSPTHEGNLNNFLNGSWRSSSTSDVCFYVYGTLSVGGISIPVVMHHYSQMSKIHRG